MTGSPGDFAIADDDSVPASGDLFLIGGAKSNAPTRSLCEALGVTPEELGARGPEDYVLRSAEADGRRLVLIAGGGRVGTLYGVYDLLHWLGVRWYAPGEINEEVPTRTLEALGELDAREAPHFLLRGFHAWENRGDTDFLLWMARNRLNYWCVEQEPKALVHKLGILLAGGGHVLTDYYLGPREPYPYNHSRFEGDEARPADPYSVSPEYQGDANGDGKLSYFEAHPEWYGLRDGKRSPSIQGGGGDNFCTSNAGALSEWMKNAIADLAEGRYRDADIINAWMLDGGKWCQCERCEALGTPTDRNLLVVHRYAQEIKKARAAGRINRPVRLLFLAYADVLAPPSRPLPDGFDHSTCIATYFPICRCYVHDFDDPGCSRNARYNQHLRGWAVDPERHYRGQLCIGEYYNVSGYKCLPLCFMSTMAPDIPYYASLGARYFHYMHCTTGNWGNKALTNWQMARQLWNPGEDVRELWRDYFPGRYGPVHLQMRAYYRHLEEMLGNVTELKYGLARRLDAGSEDLFPTTHLKYEATNFADNDGPDLQEMLAEADRCREILNQVLARRLPDRIADRVAEDERLFTYGERTLRFYDALCRAYSLLRAGDEDGARRAFAEAEALGALLKADKTSTTLSSSHANAPNALVASFASGALVRLGTTLGPSDPRTVPLLDPARGPLVLTGRDLRGGGAVQYGYGLHAYPGRIPVSEVGNYVYGAGASPYDSMVGYFRLGAVPASGLSLRLVGLKCPQPPGGEVAAEVRVNGEPLFADKVPFPEDKLGELRLPIGAGLLRQGVNGLEIRNVQPGGRLGNRPWFGIDRVELGPQ